MTQPVVVHEVDGPVTNDLVGHLGIIDDYVLGLRGIHQATVLPID